MELRIDAEFEQLIQPLTAEEHQQLETNLLADGCRDPLSVWPTRDGPPILLDGHNRYAICTAHNLPFDVVAIGVESREDALRWIITNQLGRRNLTELQKSDLRGREYNLDKGTRGGDQIANPENQGLVAQRLAEKHQVSRDTIERDGQFAEGLEQLKQIREDLPQAIITKRSQPQTRGTFGAGPRVTKARVINVGKLIREQRVTPPPFMRRGEWQDFQILEGISILAEIPLGEHQAVTELLSTPPTPPRIALQMLKNLLVRGVEGRQVIYRLSSSSDPREQSLASTLITETPPEPDPQMSHADRMLIEADRLRDRASAWANAFPQEPWTADVQALRQYLDPLQATLRRLQERIEAAHLERIAPYVTAPLSHNGNAGHTWPPEPPSLNLPLAPDDDDADAPQP